MAILQELSSVVLYNYREKPSDITCLSTPLWPFSTQSLSINPVLIAKGHTKICTRGGSTRAHAPGFNAHRDGPPTRRRMAPVGPCIAATARTQALVTCMLCQKKLNICINKILIYNRK